VVEWLEKKLQEGESFIEIMMVWRELKTALVGFNY